MAFQLVTGRVKGTRGLGICMCLLGVEGEVWYGTVLVPFTADCVLATAHVLDCIKV
jgi:hypothetical protein